MDGIIHAIYDYNRTLHQPPECSDLNTKISEEFENFVKNISKHHVIIDAEDIPKDDLEDFEYKICKDVGHCRDPIPSILENFCSNEFYIDFISLIVFFITFRVLGGIILWYRITRPTMKLKLIRWW